MTESPFALFGITPEEVEVPASVEEALETVGAAEGKSIVPWGGGERQHLGYSPSHYDLALSTARLTNMVEYVPEDLTVTVEAGMSIGALQEVLRAHGQFLAVDVARPAAQTVGGAIATRADSLRRLRMGSLRDQLIGITVANARGERVKGGGRVVKNVAGYDLPKLYCGSLGTLGLIVEASFKVAPLPERSATVALPIELDHNGEDVIAPLLASELAPSFVFLLNARAAARALSAGRALDQRQYLIMGFDGPVEAVEWQLARVGAPDAVLPDSESVLTRAALRDFSLTDVPMTVSYHILSSQVGAFSRMVEWTARKAGFTAEVAADAGVGVIFAHFEPAGDEARWPALLEDLSDKASRCGGSFILERIPEELRALDPPIWSPVLPDFPLMARLKETLDPGRMWNPGRFVGRL